MILTDELADRIHRLSVAVLKSTKEGYEKVRADTAGAEIGAGYALHAGEGSPLTQAFGFGHRQYDDPALLEEFYRGRAENWEVTVTPFTSSETLRALIETGYRPSHFEGTMCRLTDNPPVVPNSNIQEVPPADPIFMETSWRAWSGNEAGTYEPDELIRAVAQMRARRYVAFLDAEPAATASLCEFEEGVIFAGAATRTPFRGCGLQTALLGRRLHDAGSGRLAVMGAVPGSASFRNAQRAGFTPLYSTMVWMRR